MARLILLFKIINSLAPVPHHFLSPCDGGTKANHGTKFQHIPADSGPYQYLCFPYIIVAWNSLSSNRAEAQII